ncbi:MAG: NADPH:quinone oxidoreductase family protein [Sphingobium sp.]
MKALLSHEAGGPETLKIGELPPPQAGAGQIVVRVAAVSLNYPDALMIEDRYQTRPPRPFAPGGELAGTVEAVGEGVDRFRVGDRVLALSGWGGMAELVAVPAAMSFAIPDAMPFDEAASLIFTYGTTIHGLLDRAELKAGDTMLVLGAAGGIGISAIELGKALGARVVAAVSSEEKAQTARKVGADETIIYPSGPLDQAASKALAGQFKAAAPGGFEVVYDPVGGDYADPALRAIAWEGRYAVIGFTAGIPKIALNLALLKACSIVGVFWGAWAERNTARFHEEMNMLMRFWTEGKIKPLISGRFPLAEAPAAIARMSDRGAVGKTVILL